MVYSGVVAPILARLERTNQACIVWLVSWSSTDPEVSVGADTGGVHSLQFGQTMVAKRIAYGQDQVVFSTQLPGVDCFIEYTQLSDTAGQCDHGRYTLQYLTKEADAEASVPGSSDIRPNDVLSS